MKNVIFSLVAGIVITSFSACNKYGFNNSDANNKDPEPNASLPELTTVNTQVDFSLPLNINGKKAGFPFSGTISTYGGDTRIAASQGSNQLQRLKDLKLGLYRIPLKYKDGKVTSSAGGMAADTISGITWIQKIRAAGSEPMVVVGGALSDNDITPASAANLVSYFKNSGNAVKYWVIGNEPDLSNNNYFTMFNNVAAAMKAVDATIKIAGPAASWYNFNALKNFIINCGSNADILDYHHYAMGETYLSEAEALAQTVTWENEVNALRNMIATTLPAALNNMEIQAGEYNWSWRTANGYPGWNGDDRFYQPVVTVWTASVAGHVVKSGGRAHHYADLNGALGLTFENTNDAGHFGKQLNHPLPGYYGLLMFTGGNLFRPFGDILVQSTSDLANVEAFASADKNIVMINKDASVTKKAVVQAAGMDQDAVVDVWQTNNTKPFDAPVKIATIIAVDGVFSFDLPAYTVTTFVVNTGVGAAIHNLALRNTTVASASGAVNGDEAGEKAKDGNVNTKWCDNVNRDKWLQYDFGSVCTISKIVLNWEDWDVNAKYKILTSRDGSNWTESITENSNTADPRVYDNLNLTGVRYVKFFVAAADDTDAVRLMEFEVWGIKE